MDHSAGNPEHMDHEWYEELSAAAAIGELTSSEYGELTAHLTSCPRCRSVYRDFCKLSSEGLSVLAAKQQEVSDDLSPFDEASLLARCMQKLPTVPSGAASLSPEQLNAITVRYRLRHWIISPRWAVAAAGIMAAFLLGSVGYGYRDRLAKMEAWGFRQQISLLAERTKQEEVAGRQSADQLAAQLSGTLTAQHRLEQQLSSAESQNEALTAQAGALQKSLAAADDHLASAQRELKSTAELHQQDVQARLQLQSDLQQTQEQLGRQQELVAELNVKFQALQAQEKHSELAESKSLSDLPGDQQARRLFGARDLHIVDVYDVDGNGKNRQIYGRVYYVEKKLLLFYAFDLQDKKHSRVAAGFQAWGYQQAVPGKAQNLGLFYVDDSSVNRWILKVDNPRVLQRVDAVFVTLEPPHGSPVPRGRRLLYANLGGPPNHP